jgi:hypothetical protein
MFTIDIQIHVRILVLAKLGQVIPSVLPWMPLPNASNESRERTNAILAMDKKSLF